MKSLIVMLFVLISFNSFAQTTPDAAGIVLKTAYTKAKIEHKAILLMFHASWCGWCKKMEASINDPACQKFFDDNYVIVYLDILERADKTNLENPGGLDMMVTLKGDPKGGIPYWVVMDTDGKTVGTSYAPPADGSAPTAKDNVGCPAEASEVAYFASLLKASSKLTDDQLAIIKARFAKNNPVSTNAN